MHSEKLKSQLCKIFYFEILSAKRSVRLSRGGGGRRKKVKQENPIFVPMKTNLTYNSTTIIHQFLWKAISVTHLGRGNQ